MLAAEHAEFGVVNGWERVAYFKPAPDFRETHSYRFTESFDVVGAEVAAIRAPTGCVGSHVELEREGELVGELVACGRLRGPVHLEAQQREAQQRRQLRERHPLLRVDLRAAGRIARPLVRPGKLLEGDLGLQRILERRRAPHLHKDVGEDFVREVAHVAARQRFARVDEDRVGVDPLEERRQQRPAPHSQPL